MEDFFFCGVGLWLSSNCVVPPSLPPLFIQSPPLPPPFLPLLPLLLLCLSTLLLLWWMMLVIVKHMRLPADHELKVKGQMNPWPLFFFWWSFWDETLLVLYYRDHRSEIFQQTRHKNTLQSAFILTHLQLFSFSLTLLIVFVCLQFVFIVFVLVLCLCGPVEHWRCLWRRSDDWGWESCIIWNNSSLTCKGSFIFYLSHRASMQ